MQLTNQQCPKTQDRAIGPVIALQGRTQYYVKYPGHNYKYKYP